MKACCLNIIVMLLVCLVFFILKMEILHLDTILHSEQNFSKDQSQKFKGIACNSDDEHHISRFEVVCYQVNYPFDRRVIFSLLGLVAELRSILGLNVTRVTFTLNVFKIVNLILAFVRMYKQLLMLQMGGQSVVFSFCLIRKLIVMVLKN